MSKVVQGIYKDGNVAVKVDELPDDIAESTAIVVFVKNNIRKMEILKKLASCVYDESDEIKIDEKEYNALSKALEVSDMDESKTEQELDTQDNIQWKRVFSQLIEQIGLHTNAGGNSVEDIRRERERCGL